MFSFIRWSVCANLVFALGVHSASAGTSVIIESRIDSLISRMSLDEKILMLSGLGFETAPVPRLGIPSLKMTDGPVGVRGEPSTAFPSAVLLAATFDPSLIQETAAAMGDETRAAGKAMLLGPCVNIHRVPFGGRDFESYGEDPYLSGQIASHYVRGLQSQNVAASVKHFAVNDQEFERMTVDVHVDPRTLFEIHLPAFKAAVDAGAWSVMAAYNRVNGHYATANENLLNSVLKERWKFQGFVVSDWGAVHETLGTALAGLDLEMPSVEFWGPKLKAAVESREVSQDLINDKVRRLLRPMFALGLVDPSLAPQLPPPVGPKDPAHHELARKIAGQGFVLLKNEDHVLPLDLRKMKKVALIGPNAKFLRWGGEGSSHVDPPYVVTPVQAFAEAATPSLQFLVASGVPFRDEDQSSIAAAVEAARQSEAAVIFTGLDYAEESEGYDRASMDFPEGQVELIQAVAAVNPRTIVVITSGNPLAMGAWLGQVKGVLQTWYAGQEGGHAMFDVLTGAVNPSGKLPVTFLKRWEDAPTFGTYPGRDGVIKYDEGIFVGYRGYDAKGIAPQFPFGFGLSYTTFGFDHLATEVLDASAAHPKVRVSFDVTNTGSVAGAEVAQLYVHEVKPVVPRPPKELKSFAKVFLRPGEKRRFTFDLNAEAFAYFDVATMAWRVNPGAFRVLVGNSSRDLPLESADISLSSANP